MNHMKRLILCTVALAFGDFVSAAAPNILFIVSEDNGPEMGCYGTPIRTPHLDRLARRARCSAMPTCRRRVARNRARLF